MDGQDGQDYGAHGRFDDRAADFSPMLSIVKHRRSLGVIAAEVRDENSSGLSNLTGRFVAGCDGASSTVREQLGATFEGSTYKFRAALADVEIGSSDLPFPRLSTRSGPAIGIKMQEQLWRLILPLSDSEQMSLDRRVEMAVANLFDRDFHRVWQSEFQLHRRLSSTFASGRVALAGDAAHLNSPVGGQGMNAGIRDSALLSRAMLEALDRDSSEPLEEYAISRRKEIAAGVNRFTTC